MYKIFGTILMSTLLISDAAAQTIAAARTIRSKEIISEADLVILDRSISGAVVDVELVTGMEARTILYPGRPIRLKDVGPPAIITRNQIVPIIFISGALTIRAEGRALGRGGLGERIRVMNLSSKKTLSGFITQSGEVRIIP